MKTHADMKRALQAQGTRLETLALVNTNFPALSNGTARLNVGDIRYINKWDTTGVYLKKDSDTTNTRGSFLGYDKASDWTIDGDVITHKLGMSYRVILKTESEVA